MVEVVARNNNDYFRSFLPAVNSPPVPHRDLSTTSTAVHLPRSRYEDHPAAPPSHQPEPKKDKKWSIGKLFRRKKKDESSSSSESDEVFSRSLTKKKSKKKKRTPGVANFDHIVIRETKRAQSLAKPNLNDLNDDGVLSDPSAGFINYRAKVPDMYGESNNSRREEKYGKSSLETPSRKSRKKNRLKARVEALRNSMIGNSSSDEESLRSSNSSSILRFRSEESLMRSRDSSLNKRSRTARNERYIKRLSRDDENQLNKEAELLQQGYSKAEVEMLTRTPTSQSSGYGTCKRESANKPKLEQSYINEMTRRPLKSESVSSFPSTQSYPSSINFNAKVNNDHLNYSIQYPARNANREPIYANKYREGSNEDRENVMCVKFPLGNVTNVNREEKAPPVPPPRDMHRKVVTPLSMYHQNNTVVVDRYANQNNPTHGVPNNDFARVMRRSQERSAIYGVNGLRRPISNSEDHIALQNNEYLMNVIPKTDQPRRPASVSAEPKHYGLYMNTPPWKKKADHNNLIKPEAVQPKQDYLYFADQSPRSRRPISIKASQNGYDNQYLSDSHTSLSLTENIYRKPRNASEFWKKLDDAERYRRQTHIFSNSRSKSECPNQIQAYMPNVEQYKPRIDSIKDVDIQNKNKSNRSVDTTDSARMWKATTEYKRACTVEPASNQVSAKNTSKTHTRHKSDTVLSNQMQSDDDKSSERRKSTNLDDALNELEAIYNSLGLGDEDLLDRAERRELMTPKLNDRFNDWNGNDDDSVQLRSQPTTPLRSRRSDQPDKLQDDMAFRRMNSLPKEKQNHNDIQTQISYMLASPVYVPYASDDDKSSVRNEPDVVHDDVMYRNIKQSNNRLKTLDPQPPFGIPIGPVTPAPQSDYLHAMPENKSRPRFVPRRSPDIVSDDLAYRSLRKDNRHSTSLHMDELNPFVNNNHSYNEYPKYSEPVSNLKKKRAVRSLSANIFTMIQKEIDDALTFNKTGSLQKTNSNSDVMRRLRDTFENNDNDQERSPRNKVKQRHNTVSLFVNNSHSPSHHFAKDDSCIHNDDKYLAKPPSCDKSKSSSPSNRSPQVSKRSSKEEFQQVLTLLAQEAMDTSNKLGVALAEMDKNRNSMEKKNDIQSKISNSRALFLNGLTSTPADEIFPEVKHVKVHCEIIDTLPKEINKANFETTLKAKKTEDSLMEISNQLHKVEEKLKHSMEKELNIHDESINLSNYVTQLDEQKKAHETLVVAADDKSVPNISASNAQNDSIRVKSLESDVNSKFNEKSLNRHSLNPFLNAEEKCNEINGLNAFKELKDGITSLIAGISQVNDKLFIPNSTKNEKQEPDKVASISEVNEKLNQVTQQQINDNKQQVPNRASVNLSIYEDDLEIKKDAADSTEYNSSEELATIFKLDDKTKSEATKENYNELEKKVRDELSSPKLVQSMNQKLRRLSVDHTDESKPSQSNQLPNTVVPWRTKRQHSQNENRDDSSQTKRRWHDGSTLMVACSYTMMFSQHLADMDWLSLLGLLLAIVTIIAMLLI